MHRFATKCLIILFIGILPYKSKLYAEECRITEINISGNKRTSDKVILKELPFNINDIYEKEALAEKIISARGNLLNLSLFNYIYIDCFSDTSADISSMNTDVTENYNNVTIEIKVEERWYLWPLIGIKFEDRNMSTWLKDMDFSKITAEAGIMEENMFGLDHKISGGVTFGFEKGVFFNYSNISLDRNGKHTIGFGASYNVNKTVNIAAHGNIPVYMKDRKKPLHTEYGMNMTYIIRPVLRLRNTLELSYRHTMIADTILKENPSFWGSPLTSRHTMEVKNTIGLDKRDNAIYPLEGYYISGCADGIFDLNTDFVCGKLKGEIQYYLKLSRRWFLSTTLSMSASVKNRDAYIYNTAIGYENAMIRGYEHFTIDGQHYVSSNNSIKYCILPKKIITLGFLSFIPKFNKIHFTIYGKAFFDMGYVHDNGGNPSDLFSNRFLFGTGAGIDILTYYDITFGAHYALTGSGTGGIFFSIQSPLF